MDIRTELRDLMETKNYSIAYVSTATGLAKSTISMWLNKYPLQQLFQMCLYLIY